MAGGIGHAVAFGKGFVLKSAEVFATLEVASCHFSGIEFHSAVSITTAEDFSCSWFKGIIAAIVNRPWDHVDLEVIPEVLEFFKANLAIDMVFHDIVDSKESLVILFPAFAGFC